MQGLLYLGYFILGIFQLAAIMAGLEDWIGLHWLIAIPLAMIIAYIPVIGTIVGVVGAVTAWHWSWVQVGGLFFGPLIVLIFFALISGVSGSRRECL